MIVGITGGIGSGKSTIARELAKRGFVIYDCDREAKRIIAEDQGVQQAIINLLGEEAFQRPTTNDQRPIYNTAYVAKRVFEDKALLEGINKIVHPAVKEDIVAKQPDFVESAILYEAGIDALCERIIVIDAPEDIRIERTIGRDYKGEMTENNINKVRARMRVQEASSNYLKRLQTTSNNLKLVWNDGKRETPVVVDEILTWIKKQQSS